MPGWRKPLGTAIGAVALIVTAQGPGSAAPCDEYDPAAPARSAEITLDSSDFVDEGRGEMRSFVATGSLGRVVTAIVSSVPGGIAQSFSAHPEISRYSPHYGEALKGIVVEVSVEPTRRPVRVIVGLRQVCAQYFRNSFLYD